MPRLMVADMCHTPCAVYPVSYCGVLQLPLRAEGDDVTLGVALRVVHAACMYRMEFGVCPYEVSYAIQTHLFLLHRNGDKFCGGARDGRPLVDKAIMSRYVIFAMVRTRMSTEKARAVLRRVVAAIYRWR